MRGVPEKYMYTFMKYFILDPFVFLKTYVPIDCKTGFEDFPESD